MEATTPPLGATITWTPELDKPWKVRHITAAQALEDIRSGTYATEVEAVRKVLATDPTRYKEEKEKLPALAWHGKFTYRANGKLVKNGHSGLLCLDFDHLPIAKMPEIRERITADPCTLAAFTSPSGEGLKVLVRIPPDPARHGHHFDALRKRYDATLKPFGGTVKTDKNARALSQACLVSYDPDLYTNTLAEVFDVPPPAKPPPVTPPGLEDLPPAEAAELLREKYRQRDRATQTDDDTAAPILHKLVELVEPVDFRAQANLKEDQAPKGHHHLLLAIANVLAIAKGADHPLAQVNGTYYIFNGCYWQPLSRGLLRQFLGDAAERMGVDYFNANFYAFKDKLQRQFDDDAAMEPPPRRMGVVKINMANGTFVVTPKRQELREVFDPEDFMTYQLPFGYDPTAACPEFHKYLNRVLPDKDCQAVLAEFMGFVFIPQKLLNLHYALMLHGSGANGKSVFADVMTGLLGSPNISHVGLSDITKNPNARLSLEHKLVNIATEINTELDDTVFKALCAGEAVTVKQLYHDERNMTTYGKLIFLANNLPRVKDSSDGYFRRLKLVPFTQSLPKSEWDEGLARRIMDTELPGVFNWVLEGMRRLWAAREFTKAQAVEDAVADYREKSDTVLGFIREVSMEPCEDTRRTLKVWYAQYKDHCRDGGHQHPANQQTFAERLRKNGFTVRRGTGGANVVLAKCATIIDNDTF